MKVYELMALLQEQNPLNDVIYWDKYEGDNYDINGVEEDALNGIETILLN